ncbi:Chemotaxis protein CheY [Candidatus Terasakiella magnetica]|uniref:Chemotaxis protein CheY n=1 Tax=Candidatus Terasakiella magnetica TaxID=1867952 RepID=A0A1C3RI11_9PROT|nr:response regulator [Candidatus Terasakiella magnetica]SCA56921.1 Chemotaxis protein CheY [Candidatus Terasakiella magnetica]
MKRLNVMIVDDSQIMIKKIKKHLEALGHRIVATCHSGSEALVQYKKVKPDLVTMDITMADMNGIEATKVIVKDNPSALIIMVTSHGQEGMVLEAIKAGAKGYLLKPINEDQLQDTLNTIDAKYLKSA